MGAKDAIKNSFTVDDNVVSAPWVRPTAHGTPHCTPPWHTTPQATASHPLGVNVHLMGAKDAIKNSFTVDDNVVSAPWRTWALLEGTEDRVAWALEAGECDSVVNLQFPLFLYKPLLQRTWALLEGTEDRVAWALEAGECDSVVNLQFPLFLYKPLLQRTWALLEGTEDRVAWALEAGECDSVVNLQFPLFLYKPLLQRTWALLEGTEERVAWALEAVGLKHLSREPASILSMGQRKRLQLARLLAIPRSLWLLDEPSVGLDVGGVALLIAIMLPLLSPPPPPLFHLCQTAQAPAVGSSTSHPAFPLARKRLQLARLLAIPRSLWLLDEPSVGLDLAGVELLEGMIEEHRAFSPLFSPHSPAIPPLPPAQAPPAGAAARHTSSTGPLVPSFPLTHLPFPRYQRKRLQLARLVAIPRSLWLLDEPSVGLDLAGVELLEGMVEEHRAFSPLFSPHSPAIPPLPPAQAPPAGAAARHTSFPLAMR
ncbi:unnamed protein product [Closterium sp. Naga37s-1]|nr:unnamed protein product [Closterium sp. Naga37s-1]